MVPPAGLSWTDQITCVSEVPVTCAKNHECSPGWIVTDAGSTCTVMLLAGDTVTVAVPGLVGSATLVATTWKVPAACGAVERPLASTEPPAAPSANDTEPDGSVEPES